MAIFGKGDSPAEVLKRLEARGWRDGAEKRSLLQALDAGGAVPTDSLVRLLGTGDSDVVRYAVERIGQARDPRAVDLLMRAIAKAPQGRKRAYTDALRALPGEALLSRLGPMAAARDAAQRALACDLLAGVPEWSQHLDIVKRLLRDEEAGVRARAVRLLGQGVALENVRSILRELLQASDDIVRHGAIEALARDPDLEIVEDFFDRLPDEPAAIQNVMVQGMAKLVRGTDSAASRVMEQVMPLLAADDEGIRMAAASLLGAVPDTCHVLRRFLQYAKGLAFWLRERSFKSIAQGTKGLGSAMLQLLHDDDPDVVSGVLVMAGESADISLLDGLIEFLERSELDWWVRLTAIETIHNFRDARVAPALRALLDDDELRTAAMACLAERRDASALPRVIEFFSHERRGLRMAAIQAAQHYEDPRFLGPLEMAALRDEDDEVRSLATEVLDGYGSEGVATAASIREQRRKQNAALLGNIELEMESDLVD